MIINQTKQKSTETINCILCYYVTIWSCLYNASNTNEMNDTEISKIYFLTVAKEVLYQVFTLFFFFVPLLFNHR